VDNEIGPAELDVDALRTAQPDLVIVRETVSGSGLGSRRVREVLGDTAGEPVIVSLDPVSMEGIFHSVTTIGAMVEAEDDAMELLEALREELGDLEQQVVVRQDQGVQAPRVVMLQGIEPPEFRLRVGDYRVRFHCSGDALEVTAIRHRREVYR